MQQKPGGRRRHPEETSTSAAASQTIVMSCGLARQRRRDPALTPAAGPPPSTAHRRAITPIQQPVNWKWRIPRHRGEDPPNTRAVGLGQTNPAARCVRGSAGGMVRELARQLASVLFSDGICDQFSAAIHPPPSWRGRTSPDQPTHCQNPCKGGRLPAPAGRRSPGPSSGL